MTLTLMKPGNFPTVTVVHKVTVEHYRDPLDLAIGTVEQGALTSPSGHKAAECEPRIGSPLPTTSLLGE